MIVDGIVIVDDMDFCGELCNYAEGIIKCQRAEIKELNREVDRLSQIVLYHDGQIVDAIKDFAESLKIALCEPERGLKYKDIIAVSACITELVKEKVGY